MNVSTRVEAALGAAAKDLLEHRCQAILRGSIATPGPDFVDRVFGGSNRNPRVLASMRRLFGAGRLGGSGYLSILPVDHGVAHTAGMVFAPNPAYLDPLSIAELAIEGGCSGLVTTYGAVGTVARAVAHRLPLILKINHDEQFAHPARYDNILFARVREAASMGCVAVGATVYFGGPEARRQLQEVARAFTEAHVLGLATILFCYLHPRALLAGGKDIIFAADLTGEANHQGATIGADFIKQKQPLFGSGLRALQPGYGRTDERLYPTLIAGHPIDLTRYQVMLSYAGRCGVIHSGGASSPDSLRQALRAAVVNKRGGGMGLLAGRKVFQKPLSDGVALLHAIQDVYLDPSVTVA